MLDLEARKKSYGDYRKWQYDTEYMKKSNNNYKPKSISKEDIENIIRNS